MPIHPFNPRYKFSVGPVIFSDVTALTAGHNVAGLISLRAVYAVDSIVGVATVRLPGPRILTRLYSAVVTVTLEKFYGLFERQTPDVPALLIATNNHISRCDSEAYTLRGTIRALASNGLTVEAFAALSVSSP